jgi:hypothetical protein
VFDNHLCQDAKSPMRGMVYEYLDVARKGQYDQWVQGEGLDTMHDGAWLAAALVSARGYVPTDIGAGVGIATPIPAVMPT